MKKYIGVLLMTISGFCEASGSQIKNCSDSNLALLYQNLTEVKDLLDIRSDLLDRSSSSQHDIIDNRIDPSLMLSISTTTLKDAFNDAVYYDRTAKLLYKKNAIKMMHEFCRYKPKNIDKYKEAMNTIISDCLEFKCEQCELLMK